MLITKSGIRVISYVHTERGLVEMDELTPEEKIRAATEIKLQVLRGFYAGQAEFEAGADPSVSAGR